MYALKEYKDRQRWNLLMIKNLQTVDVWNLKNENEFQDGRCLKFSNENEFQDRRRLKQAQAEWKQYIEHSVADAPVMIMSKNFHFSSALMIISEVVGWFI